MKILCILNDLDLGGAQNYTISLLNEFVKQGHVVKLIILSNNLSLKNRLICDIECIVLPRKHKLDFSVLKKIRYELKFGCFNLVISSYILYHKLASFLLNSKIPVIYPIHSTIARTRKDVIFRWFLFKLKKKNEIYLTSIDSQTQYLTQHYSLKDNFFNQIYNGINTERFQIVSSDFNKTAFLTNLGLNIRFKVILMVAGFRKEKRHKDAIMAFKLLKEKYSDVSLIMVGDNRLQKLDELIQFIREVNVNDIVILSAEQAGDILNYYWSADLFTLTSNKVETFPISSLEAMACGLPCVLTNIGGAKDFIKDGYNGFLVEPENVESIMNGWKKTLQNISHFDKKNIRENIVKNFSIENSASQYLKLIKSIN